MATPNTQPPGQISHWQLKVSYWYINHKLQLKKVLVGVLIAFCVILYSYSIYRLVVILINDQAQQADLANLPNNLIDYSYFRQTQKPQDLQILSSNALKDGEGKYDFIFKVKNPNNNFVALNVTYQLLVNDQILAEKTGYVYAGEEKYLGIFGQEIADAAGASVRIVKVDWSRFNNFSVYGSQRLKFKVSDINFKAAGESGVKGDLPVSILNFKILNDSAYGYWHVGVYMILLNGTSPVGANYISLDNLLSKETREVEMRWYESLPAVSSVEIYPEADIISSESFMPVNQ
ncbi:MAG: hypothetical protein WCX71_00385 [Candidatus Buchananbacteria bacterium]